MFGPGEYRPDPSEGITVPAALPQPEIVPYSRNDLRQPCPHCGHAAYRDKQAHRTLHDVGNLDVWCPRDLRVTYSQHYCTKCRKYFSRSVEKVGLRYPIEISWVCGILAQVSTSMFATPGVTMILQVLIAMMAGWINRHQQHVITYLKAENQVLKAKLQKQRRRLTNTERRRLAA